MNCANPFPVHWPLYQYKDIFPQDIQKECDAFLREKTQLSNWRYSGEQWNVFFLVRLSNKRTLVRQYQLTREKGPWRWWERKCLLTGNTRSSPLIMRLVSVNENTESWTHVQREDQGIWKTAKQEWTQDCTYIIIRIQCISRSRALGSSWKARTKDLSGSFFKQLTDLLKTSNFKTSRNRHIENLIGGTYKTLLSYMDTERDKSAMKYILSAITCVKFASKLQNISNKESIRRSRDITPCNLRRFSELRNLMKRLVEAD